MKYFGTDGIRLENISLLKNLVIKTTYALKQMNAKKVVVGYDGRPHGKALTKALIKNLNILGIETHFAKIVPSACVSLLTLKKSADYGIMITASHNPSYVNGIKIFNKKGEKLTKTIEKKIEALFEQLPYNLLEKHILNYAKENNIKKEKAFATSINEYLETLHFHTPNLKGKKIVLDCANGASKKLAKNVFAKTRAKIVFLNRKNSKFINQDCGAIFPKSLQKKVVKEKADFGFAFDGDADRCVCVLSDGSLLSGDNVLVATARYYNFSKIVGTIYSNGAIEKALQKNNITFLRSKVGDQEVKKLMNKEKCQFGGERSGHFIFADIMPTGDGMLSALKISAIEDFEKLQHFKKIPSKTVNITTNNKKKLEKQLQTYKDKYTALLNGKGRVMIRASGTEPNVRVLIENDDTKVIEEIEKLLSQ